MERNDIIQNSPLRALDTALGAVGSPGRDQPGGLGRGNLGIVMARHGAGKTPFLVAVALDHLLRGERVLHVSLEQKVDHVRDFYDQIFEDLARNAHLDDVRQVHLEVERARRIHTYLGGTFTIEKLRTAVAFMRDHASFTPDLIAVDDFDFARNGHTEVEAVLAIAREVNAELWMTAVRHRHEPITDQEQIPEPASRIKDLARVIVSLHTDGDIRCELLKPGAPRELPFVLDRVTMLVKGK